MYKDNQFEEVTVDGSDNIIAVGWSMDDASVVTAGAHQTTFASSAINVTDGLLVKFDENGIRQWGTYIGGNDEDIVYAVCTDASGNIFTVGTTYSSSTANIYT